MRKVSLAQLEAFNAILRLGSFRAAAQALNVTQPTITLRVRELESALGVRLFTRVGRSMRLTAEGTLVGDYASREVGLIEEMLDQIRSRDPLKTFLHLGTSDMVAITCLPEIIQIIEQTHPLLKIEVTVASSLELSRLVFERKLDVALISNPQVIEGVQLREIAHAEVAWLGIPDPVLSRANLRPADLAHRKVLTVPAPNVLSSYIGDWCAEQNVPMLSVSTCNSVAIIARLVAAGVAISVLPTCVLADELDAGEVVRYGERTTFAPIRIGMAFQKNIRSDSADGVAAAIGHAMSAKKLFQMV